MLTAIHMRSPGCVLATSGPLVLMFWLGAGDGSELKAAHRLSVELGRTYPRGIAHVNLVAHGGGGATLSDEARQGVLAILRDPEVPLVASALVLPGEGFLSAFVRAVLAGAMLLARSKAAFRFVASVPDAEAFLRTPGRIADALKLPPLAVVQAVEAVRAELEPGSRI